MSTDQILPAFTFDPMSPTLRRLIELDMQARQSARFFGLDRSPALRAPPPARPAGTPVEPAAPEQDGAAATTSRLDLRA